MKKLLLALMLGGALLGNAESTTAEFSYIDGVEDFFGLGPNYKVNVYDVAILLPGDVFEGCSIKDISMPVRSISGIENYGVSKVWLSSKLSLSNGENVPDLGSYDAAISMVGDQAVLSGSLPESYVIGENGVYVGVSLSVLASDDSTDYPVSLGNSDSKDSFWIHIPSSQSYLRWTNGHTKFGYGCGISATIDNVPEHAVRIVNFPDVFTALDKPSSVDVTLSAIGSKEITSVDFEYQLGGQHYTSHYDLPVPVVAGIANEFTATVEIPAQSMVIDEKVEFKVVKVNGEANSVDSAVADAMVYVLANLPVRQTLMEEYTGTWCGYCTRGYAALEYIKENHPEFVVAAFHGTNGAGTDPMIITSNFPKSPANGYPGAWLNRSLSADPYYGVSAQANSFSIVDDILALNAEFTPWSIEVSHAWDSEDVLTATANLTNVMGYESGSYKIAYLLVADGLSGTANSWRQSNYYASENPVYIEQLNAFCRGGEYSYSKVAGLVFNDVVISTTGIHGVAGSVPTSLEKNGTVTHSIDFDLTKIPETLLQDKSKLRVIAAVVDKNGKVLNCAKNEVNDYFESAVAGIFDENAPIEYFNLNGIKVTEPAQGIFIRRQGSKSEKVIIR